MLLAVYWMERARPHAVRAQPAPPMKLAALVTVTVLAVLCFVVICFDALSVARSELRRRRQARAGTFGVVVDSRGRVLGVYRDPFIQIRQGARAHRGDSPWTTPGPDGEAWAWEGFGPTEEEARLQAERLRRRYLQLLPGLGEETEEWRG